MLTAIDWQGSQEPELKHSTGFSEGFMVRNFLPFPIQLHSLGKKSSLLHKIITVAFL